MVSGECMQGSLGRVKREYVHIYKYIHTYIFLVFRGMCDEGIPSQCS